MRHTWFPGKIFPKWSSCHVTIAWPEENGNLMTKCGSESGKELAKTSIFFFYFEHAMISTVAFRDRKSFVVPLKVLSYNIIMSVFLESHNNFNSSKGSFEPLYYNIKLCKLGKEKSAKAFSFVVSFVKYYRLWNAQFCLRLSAIYQRNSFKVGTLDRRSNKN